MPRLSVWTIRAALVALGIGFLFGALMLANKGVPFDPSLWRLLPAHIELVLLGWTMQLALGVAFWILPRFSGGRRGNVPLAWASVALLNAGVIAVALAGWVGGWLAVAGRAAELLAAAAFAAHAWPRVKPPGA